MGLATFIGETAMVATIMMRIVYLKHVCGMFRIASEEIYIHIRMNVEIIWTKFFYFYIKQKKEINCCSKIPTHIAY